MRRSKMTGVVVLLLSLLLVVMLVPSAAFAEEASEDYKVKYIWAEDNSFVEAELYYQDCEVCEESEEAQTTYQVKVRPTSVEEGVGIYSARFKNTKFENQTKEVIIEKLTEKEEEERNRSFNYLKTLITLVNKEDHTSYKRAGVDALERAIIIAQSNVGRAVKAEDINVLIDDILSARNNLQQKTTIAGAKVSGIKAAEYTGKPIMPEPVIVLSGKVLKAGYDYSVQYTDNVEAGTAYVLIKGTGDYTGSITRRFDLKKATNTLNVSAKTARVKRSRLKKRNQKLSILKAITVYDRGQGTLRFTKVKGSRKIKVNKKTGQITVKKGLKKGTYKVKLKVLAKGNANYKSLGEVVTVKIRVK